MSKKEFAECTYCKKHWNNDSLITLLWGHFAHEECHDNAMAQSKSPYRRLYASLRGALSTAVDRRLITFNRGPHAVKIKVTLTGPSKQS